MSIKSKSRLHKLPHMEVDLDKVDSAIGSFRIPIYPGQMAEIIASLSKPCTDCEDLWEYANQKLRNFAFDPTPRVRVSNFYNVNDVGTAYWMTGMCELFMRVLLEASCHDKALARWIFARVLYPSVVFYSSNFESYFDVSLASGHYGLSAREEEVIELREKGKSLKEIAGTLKISVNTVNATMRRVLRKTGTRSASEALAKLHKFDARQDRLQPATLRLLAEAVATKMIGERDIESQKAR